ncbi:MAG: replication protein [Candidatus Thiodiazotropha endolucinida]|nr:replication protein [Candidatus Thiodiazotropha taylori]MCW4225231.1 replication protein [Candidatus Thiodiazotropha endolucinida]MCG7880783.1 replication protein [Candidatus Thiodiazotropha taylori]MCG7886802.1 replication protein [Candidatus Thiodiazotropha taylori]MCG8028189.1 replication protein [Candidatus Thiodiazotropha taylori]
MATKSPAVEIEELPEKDAFNNQQLSLFQNFLASGDDSHLSNTIELWDAVPKYHVTYQRQNSIRKNGFLPTLNHEFQHRQRGYSVSISPARIRTAKGEIEYYPGPNEEILEDVLRKMASDAGNGYLDEDRSGVSFSVHALKKELAARGHTRSFSEINTSLLILAGCRIELNSDEGEGLYSSAILSSLLGVTRKKLEREPDARWFADFSSLVTIGIKKLNYRQFDYQRMLGHKKHLSRWLHKRLAHNYKQASRFNTYAIRLTTIQRDSAMLPDVRASQRLKRVRDTLQELVTDRVLSRWEDEEERGPRNAILDVKFTLYTHQEFNQAVTAANTRAKANQFRLNEINKKQSALPLR